jgi:uncharacterized protein YcfJ
MKRLVLAPLVLAAAVAAGAASAQDARSYGYDDRGGYTYEQGPVGGDRSYDRYADRYDERYGDGYDRYDRGYVGGIVTPDRYGRSGTYDMARVLRVDPIVGGRGQCVDRPAYGDRYAYGDGYPDPYRRGYADPYARGYRQPARTTGVGAAVGALIGGAIGNAVADGGRRDYYGYRRGGSDRAVATVLGAVVGGAIGAGVERSATQRRDYYGGQYGGQAYGHGDPRYGGQGYGGQGYYGSTVSNCRTGYDRVDGYRVTYEYAGRRYETVTDYHPGRELRVRVDVRPEY